MAFIRRFSTVFRKVYACIALTILIYISLAMNTKYYATRHDMYMKKYTSNITTRSAEITHAALRRRTLSTEYDFYRELYQPSGVCRKLTSLGGLGCERRLEGNKFICLDEGLMPKRNNCLVYSFGVGADVTFEDDLYQPFHCETHMFDPTVTVEDMKNETYAYWNFNELGIAGKAEIRNMTGKHVDIGLKQFLTFDTIQRRLGHAGRRVDYMKLDVEGDEWGVFQSMVISGAINNVQQIGVEIHTYDIRYKTPELWLSILQDRYAILLSVEAAGFQLVNSMNNTLSISYIKLPALSKPIPSCIELLYVRKTLQFNYR